MKKTDKKIENAIRKSLTEVCEIALKDIEGFEWITHHVNYNQFPKSLLITCVFDTQTALSKLLSSGKEEYLYLLIEDKLGMVNIPINNIRKQVSFDTKEGYKDKYSA